MTKETIIKSTLKYLVKRQIEEGSVGFAVDNDPDHDCCWDDVLAWIEAQPSEDCISRQKALDCFEQTNTRQGAKYAIETLPSVKPQYTDEEIDKAQAVEQAYVDKMVELAVEETKERYSDAIEKIKKAIDEMTEIHSDGEFYIKNVDAKWIIGKYLCGAEMSGSGEDEVSN